MTKVQNSHTYQCQTGFCNRLPAYQEEKLTQLKNQRESSEEGQCFLDGNLTNNEFNMRETPSHCKALLIFSQM